MSAILKASSAMKLCAAAALLLALAHTASAATVGPVTDDIGVIRIAKGAPIQIGGYWVLSGADTSLGLDGKRGAEIAFAEIGNKLLGHPIKFNVEDDQMQRGRWPDRGDQARVQSADRHRAGWRLFQCGHTGRADSVAAGHYQHLQCVFGAGAHCA